MPKEILAEGIYKFAIKAKEIASNTLTKSTTNVCSLFGIILSNFTDVAVLALFAFISKITSLNKAINAITL